MVHSASTHHGIALPVHFSRKRPQEPQGPQEPHSQQLPTATTAATAPATTAMAAMAVALSVAAEVPMAVAWVTPVEASLTPVAAVAIVAVVR